jgi:hypothetical protein
MSSKDTPVLESHTHPFASAFQDWTSDIPIAMDSFVAMAPLFGYALVDRSGIRKGQDPELARNLGCQVPGSELPTLLADQFFYGSVDMMMTRDPQTGEAAFYVVEVNGSNAAGLTDVALPDVARIADSVAASLQYADLPPGAVILNSYTGDKNINVHERVTLFERMRSRYPDRRLRLVSTPALETPEALQEDDTLFVVTGPISHILPHLQIQNQRLHLQSRPVAIIINDLTVDRIQKALPAFESCRDRTLVLNRIHPVTNLKARTYEALSHRIVPALTPHFPLRAFSYWRADTRPELEALALQLTQGEKRSVVLKPFSSSVGLGIAFLTPEMSKDDVLKQVDTSIAEAEERYQGTSDLFPYTVCEFVETSLCHFPERGLMNRKFDLRFFVVRDGDGLYGIPGVIKLASQEYDTASFHREGLQTNTMRLTQAKKTPMHEIFETLIQPISNPNSLKALGLSAQEVQHLSRMACHVVGHLVNELNRDS